MYNNVGGNGTLRCFLSISRNIFLGRFYSTTKQLCQHQLIYKAMQIEGTLPNLSDNPLSNMSAETSPHDVVRWTISHIYFKLFPFVLSVIIDFSSQSLWTTTTTTTTVTLLQHLLRCQFIQYLRLDWMLCRLILCLRDNNTSLHWIYM